MSMGPYRRTPSPHCAQLKTSLVPLVVAARMIFTTVAASPTPNTRSRILATCESQNHARRRPITGGDCTHQPVENRGCPGDTADPSTDHLAWLLDPCRPRSARGGAGYESRR